MYVSTRQRLVLVGVAVAALCLYFVFVRAGVDAHGADYDAKIGAARSTLAAEQAILTTTDSERLDDRPVSDPVIAAMIGLPSSAITTDAGSLKAKITSTNPNFAALIVDRLRAAGVGPGSVVAISCTGSFPALNIAAIAAVEALGADPLIVGSVGASTWGANDPEFTYLDMEALLVERGILHHRTLAASIGGDFRIRPMPEEGRALAKAAIERNHAVFLQEPRLQDAVKQRLAIIESAAGDRPIAAFINVGGGLASVGPGTRAFSRDLTVGPPTGDIEGEGLMYYMSEQGIPVINLSNVVQLAREARLPVQPETMPPLRQGEAYHDWTRIRVLAGVAAVMVLMTIGVARLATLVPASGDRFFDAYFGFLPTRLRERITGDRNASAIPAADERSS